MEHKIQFEKKLHSEMDENDINGIAVITKR